MTTSTQTEGRVVCLSCGRLVTLNSDETVRKHNAEGTGEPCEASNTEWDPRCSVCNKVAISQVQMGDEAHSLACSTDLMEAMKQAFKEMPAGRTLFIQRLL